MKKIFYLISIIFFSCSQGKNNNSKSDTKTSLIENRATQHADPFAIVELFTSEGCSDCPPAEIVLNKIVTNAMANKTNVFPLAFHVDYWNKLGWKDVFSDSSYSNRQRKYRIAFSNKVVYTPQMIINGTTEFTGSNSAKADSVISASLKNNAPAYFTIHPTNELDPAGKINVEYEIIQIPENNSIDYDFCFAIVERGLITHVKKGENSGKTLNHENIVRLFYSYELKDKKGVISLPALGSAISKNHSLVAFIQEKKTMRIIGANLWNF